MTRAPGHSEVTHASLDGGVGPSVQDPRVQVKRVQSGPAHWGALGIDPRSPQAAPPGGAFSDSSLSPGRRRRGPRGQRDAGRERNVEGGRLEVSSRAPRTSGVRAVRPPAGARPSWVVRHRPACSRRDRRGLGEAGQILCASQRRLQIEGDSVWNPSHSCLRRMARK